MEKYKKPIISCRDSFNGVFPAAIMPIVGLSFKGLALVGAAAGLATGMASSKGVDFIDSTNTAALTARKDFALS